MTTKPALMSVCGSVTRMTRGSFASSSWSCWVFRALWAGPSVPLLGAGTWYERGSDVSAHNSSISNKVTGTQSLSKRTKCVLGKRKTNAARTNVPAHVG